MTELLLESVESVVVRHAVTTIQRVERGRRIRTAIHPGAPIDPLQDSQRQADIDNEGDATAQLHPSGAWSASAVRGEWSCLAVISGQDS